MDGLLARIPYPLLREWEAFYRQDPWGEWRADLREAKTTAAVLNQWRGKKDKVIEVADVMPRFGAAAAAKPEAPSEDRLLEKFKALNALLGGSVVARGSDDDRQPRPDALGVRRPAQG